MANEGPTIYADLMSQPSRAVVIFCRVNRLPINLRLVRLDKGEHRQPWYLELNPLGKVPLLVDGDLKLPESPAILLHLANKYAVPDHWAPRWPPAGAAGDGDGTSAAAAAARAARFHSALAWQASTLRGAAMTLLFHRAVGRVFGARMSDAVAESGLASLKVALRDLDRAWLGGGGGGGGIGGSGRFLAGDEVSVADVLAACELEQLRLLDGAKGPGMQELLSRHAAVRDWMARVRDTCGPDWDDVHATLRAAVAAMAKQAAPAPKL